jgi:GNAT superfamily N-acetyltransferase
MSVQGPSGAPETMLLVRRAVAADLRTVTDLLDATGLGAEATVQLLTEGGVFLLGDVAAPSGAPGLAALALELDLDRRTARVSGVAVALPFRRRGLGRRLLAGAVPLLQSQGYEYVVVRVWTGSPTEAFLSRCGFREVPAMEERASGIGSQGPGGAVGEWREYGRDL